MDKENDKETEQILKHLKRLIGKTVNRVAIEAGPHNGTPIHGLEFTDGTIMWCLRDPEGNGAGYLDIENYHEEE